MEFNCNLPNERSLGLPYSYGVCVQVMQEPLRINETKLQYEALYKEYEYLRDKMRHLETQNLSITTFTISGWLVAVGLFEKAGIPDYLIPFILIGILIVGSSMYRSNKYNHWRCHTYIQVFIEGQIPWLSWETLVHQFRKPEKKDSLWIYQAISVVKVLVTSWPTWLLSVTTFFSLQQTIAFSKVNSLWMTWLYSLLIIIGIIIVIQVLRGSRNMKRIEFVDRWSELYKQYHKLEL